MLEIIQNASPIKRDELTHPRRVQCKRLGICRECGARFEAKRVSREFCSTKCRQIFHNRAAARGADLFHLFMAMRFDRAKAEAAGAWSLLCRMAAAFKLEDDHDRDGRTSWDDVEKVKARNVHLLSTVVSECVVGHHRPAKRTASSRRK
jgi:hypothetical protein